MSRRGRKRKQGARFPGGKLRRVSMAELHNMERATVRAQPHRRDLDEQSQIDPRAETVAGRLFLKGVLTQEQAWAADRFRNLAHQFHMLLAAPAVTGSALYAMVDPGVETVDEPGIMGAEVIETPEERHSRILGQWDAAVRCLHAEGSRVVKVQMSSGGEEPMRRNLNFAALVKSVVVENRMCDDIDALRDALSALAAHWGFVQTKPLRLKAALSEKAHWAHEEREISIVYASGSCDVGKEAV